MNKDEIDAMIARARAALVGAFTASLRERGIVDLQRYCAENFQVSVKKRRFVLQVSCAEALGPADGEVVVEETDRGPRLLHVDRATGERRVILSITPRAHLVFQAHSTFAAPEVVVVESTGDVAALRRAAEAGALTVDEAWR
ncbi:MAG: hypothetical protein R3B09_09460 [Nannocystaceae bacterium]